MEQVQPERTKRFVEKLRRELGAVICRALDDATVVEIMLNPDGRLWIERLGQSMECAGELPTAQAESAMTTVAASINTTITAQNPILECELLLDGSRFEALIPPVVSAPVFTIRRKASQIFALEDYVRQGTMTESQAQRISEAVVERENILVVGGTGSGKTTLTNGIIREMVRTNAKHRIVIIEDTAEIQCAAANAVILRTTDEVDMLRLLKATMRLRPDRILVGEVRGGEALALLKAWNTGHPGGVATVHANNARAGLIRLQQLISEVSQAPMEVLIGEAVQVVVSIAKTAIGRRVEEVLVVKGHDGRQFLFEREE